MPAHRTADATVSAYQIVSVTPSDATIIPITRALWIGVTGNVAITDTAGNVVTIPNVPVGVLPVQAQKVMATNTTATSILAFY